jgi:hypothetical protein
MRIHFVLRERNLFSIDALQVPIVNESKAIEFVQGMVPSAVVTQRHMGALSFNAPKLQVTFVAIVAAALFRPSFIMPALANAFGSHDTCHLCNFRAFVAQFSPACAALRFF